jgi:rapamycin-insensitive companion of mTOR
MRLRTCFFVLGLISSTSQGAEILDDYHWEATLSPLGTPTGLCIPVDVEKFMLVRRLMQRYTGAILMTWIQIPSWDPPSVTDGSDDSRLLPPTTQVELEVITAIQNLGNTVIANAASRSLTKYVLSSTPLESLIDYFLE